MQINIVSSGFNCSKFYKDLFESIEKQTDKNFNFHLINDTNREGTVMCRASTFDSINEGIVVWLDSDDMLMPNAIERIREVYTKNNNLLLTYGSFKYINNDIININLEYNDDNFRNDVFKFVPLRTFRIDLWKNYRERLNLIKDLKIYPDADMWFSFLEMAGKKRIKLLNEILYIYRHNNPNSVLKTWSADERNKELSLIKQFPKCNLI